MNQKEYPLKVGDRVVCAFGTTVIVTSVGVKGFRTELREEGMEPIAGPDYKWTEAGRYFWPYNNSEASDHLPLDIGNVIVDGYGTEFVVVAVGPLGFTATPMKASTPDLMLTWSQAGRMNYFQEGDPVRKSWLGSWLDRLKEWMFE